MGRLVEVLSVETEELDETVVLGANVDTPAAGRRLAAAAVEVAGWALGPNGPADAIEVTLNGAVIGRGTRQRREDLATGFGETAEAEWAGFEATVNVSRTDVEAELTVAATFAEKIVTVGRLRIRPYWRGELERGADPLVSIVIAAVEARADLVDLTLRDLDAQRYAKTEVLVVAGHGEEPSLDPEWRRNGVRELAEAPREPGNEGIRASNGDLLLFLPAGSVLAPDAIGLALEMLARKPGACAVIDGDGSYVAAALYRRSTFEELRGFDPGAANPELELAERALPCGAVLAPGALVGGGR